MDKVDAAAPDLVRLLSGLDDPRACDGQRHRLSDVLVIAFCTVLCGQEEFTAMQRFGQEKADWLRGFLELPGGIPSHDTFRSVLSALEAKQLAQALIAWTEQVREKLARPEMVATDGKSARRGVAKGARTALHLVNAWAVDSGGPTRPRFPSARTAGAARPKARPTTPNTGFAPCANAWAALCAKPFASPSASTSTKLLCVYSSITTISSQSFD